MTVIREADANITYWHEVFGEVKGTNSAKVCALLYLAMGTDYAYNMAIQFRNSKIGDKALIDQSQLQPILSDLEKKKFLTSKEDTRGGRKRKYFTLNRQVLCSPTGVEFYHLPPCSVLNISDDQIEDFLIELGKRDRNQYFSRIKSVNRFDFITFLVILQEEARVHCKDNAAQHLDAYLREIERLERDRRRVHLQSYRLDVILEKDTEGTSLVDPHREDDEPFIFMTKAACERCGLSTIPTQLPE
jgi:hypothetical protein